MALNFRSARSKDGPVNPVTGGPMPTPTASGGVLYFNGTVGPAPVVAPVRVEEPAIVQIGPAAGAPVIYSPVTDPYYQPPFAGAYLAPPAPMSSPSMINAPPGLITQQTALNMQAEVNTPTAQPSPNSFNWWDSGANLVKNLVAAGAAPEAPAIATGGIATASMFDIGSVPAWAWLTFAGFAAYLFMGRKRIHVGFSRSKARTRRKRR